MDGKITIREDVVGEFAVFLFLARISLLPNCEQVRKQRTLVTILVG